ncbi:hypothetical protein FACS1894125_6820 [Actinomycetota bacterium]|nr:hypothetical protein FACS1894125_6820 [Actinomycetota bacterium]
MTCQGSVPEAISCFLYTEGYEECIRTAVSLGGDADTQAAIAGSIAEAFYGGIPGEYIYSVVEEVLTTDLLEVVRKFNEMFDLSQG